MFLVSIFGVVQSINAEPCYIWQEYYNRFQTWTPVNGSDRIEEMWVYRRMNYLDNGYYYDVFRYYNWEVLIYSIASYDPFSFGFDNWHADWYEHGGQDHFTDGATSYMKVLNLTDKTKSVSFTVYATAVDSEGLPTGPFIGSAIVIVPANGYYYGNPVSGNYKNGTMSVYYEDK